jgi:F-box/WD-40 domain protein 7
LFSGSYDGTVRAWDADSLHCLGVMRGHTGPVRTLVRPGCAWVGGASNGGGGDQADARNHGAPALFSASYDYTVRAWSTTTLECLAVLTGHTAAVRALVAAGDRHVASGSDDATVRVWDASTGQCIKTLEGHDDNVRVLASSGRYLFSGSWDKTIRAYDLRTYDCVRVLEGHTEAVLALAVTPTHLASGSYDATLRFWRLDGSWRCDRKCSGHEDAVRVLASGEDGTVFSGSYDGTVGVW